MNYKMNCEFCEKKLSELYLTEYINMTKVNEVGQTVDTGTKELYFCNYKCACKRHEHFSVKGKNEKLLKRQKKGLNNWKMVMKMET